MERWKRVSELWRYARRVGTRPTPTTSRPTATRTARSAGGWWTRSIMVKKFKDTIPRRSWTSSREATPCSCLTARSPPIAPSTRSRTISRCPMVGSRNLLRSEDRGGPQDYYWLLNEAGCRRRGRCPKPEDINALSIVKLHHAKKKLERGFFTASPTTSTGRRPTAHRPRGHRGGVPGRGPHGGIHHRAGVQPGLLLLAPRGGGRRRSS